MHIVMQKYTLNCNTITHRNFNYKIHRYCNLKLCINFKTMVRLIIIQKYSMNISIINSEIILYKMWFTSIFFS